MLARLFLLFVLTCIAELALLLWFADHFGWRVALGEIFASGLLGVLITRWQNVATLRRVQNQLAAGEAPTATVLHGMMIATAGILLIIPGLITDVIGLLLLVPLFRKLLGLSAAAWFYRRFRMQSFSSHHSSFEATSQPNSTHQMPRIIDVNVIERGTEESRDED